MITPPKRIRNIGRRGMRDLLGEGSLCANSMKQSAKPVIKKPWSPIREACSIVAIFSHLGDDKRWVINPDHVTRQDRKASRQLLRSVGGIVG
jgi:hypothetical protein